MAKIVDPDNLTQNAEVVFITGSKTIELIKTATLSTDGVSLQTLYSFIKEEWKDDSNLIKYAFPMLSITSEQFELINGWNFSGSTTDPSASAYLVRDGGWAVVDPITGQNSEEWANITTLGSFDDPLVDLAYYVQSASAVATPSDFELTGQVNQAVQLYVTESFDYRDFFTIYLREQGKTYGIYDLLTEQNITALTYRKYAMPLSNGTDLKITNTDGDVSTIAPYDNMTITYYTQSQTFPIGGGSYEFDVVIDGNFGTAEQIYEFVQWSLRQETDIDTDAGSDKRGDIAAELLAFIGDTLRGESGVYIDNFAPADTNRLEFFDTGSVLRTFPFVAAGTIFFNNNLSGDTDAIYRLFFTSGSAGEWGTETAIIINDNSGPTPIAGTVSAQSQLGFDYDYDNNVQRVSPGAGTDAPYTAVAIGLGTAQYVVTTGTITRSTANTVNFVSSLERNYLNP